jgi:hypothetical protein
MLVFETRVLTGGSLPEPRTNCQLLYSRTLENASLCGQTLGPSGSETGGVKRHDTWTRERALDALAMARRDQLTLKGAASRVGLPPEEVLRLTAPGWERRGGSWRPTREDQLRREMTLLTPDGPVSVRTRNSRLATQIARHHNAVRHYVTTGSTRRLAPFSRLQVPRTSGLPYRFATDPADIDRLAAGAELLYDVYLRF